jgi:hypothetical protein
MYSKTSLSRENSGNKDHKAEYAYSARALITKVEDRITGSSGNSVDNNSQKSEQLIFMNLSIF